MTKEEYYELLINSDKQEYFVKLLDVDDVEGDKLSQEIMNDLPFNTIFCPLNNDILKKVITNIDDTTLAISLRFATEQTKEKLFSCISKNKIKEIEKILDLNGPQMFRVIIENQKKIIDKFIENGIIKNV